MPALRAPGRAARRTKTWIIQAHEDETYDVLRNGRRLANRLTWPAARRRVREDMAGNDRVLFEESDGYRRDITKTV